MEYSEAVKDLIKYIESYEKRTKKCFDCKGRGLLDKDGDGDVGWGHVEKCSKCDGTGKCR